MSTAAMEVLRVLKRARCVLSLVSLALAAAGCAGVNAGSIGLKLADAVAPTVAFKVPARNADAGALRSVVIVTDGTEVAQQVGQRLESSMGRLRIDERPHYSTVKIGPRIAGMPADAQFVALARSNGVEAVVLVTGGASTVKNATSSEDRFTCATETKLFKSCPQGQSRTNKVSCTTTEGLSAVRIRVVRANDARAVVAETVGGESRFYRCSDSTGPQADSAELVAAAVSNNADQAMQLLAPSYVSAPLDIMRADAALPAAQRKDFDAASDFARAKRMDEACRRFDELYMDLKESIALTFNVAFCAELRGDLLRANQGYRRASELANAPEPQIDRRLAGTEKSLRDNPTVFLPTSEAKVATNPRGPAGTETGRRVALVIGNAKYQRSALVNPVSDARLVSDRLKRVGFEVTELENVDAARFGTAVADFAVRAKGVEIALFYYAGHALQADGENFLLPVDNGKFRTMDDVRDGGGMQLATIVAQLDVAGPLVKLLVIDACRDNPLPSSNRSLAGGGLAAVKQPPQGGLIAFATAPGRVAEDGAGRNSVFSKHFSDQMMVPDQTVEQLFKRVRAAVKTETKNRQEPTEVSSLVGDVMFVKSK